ncbi:arylsulfatase [Rhodoblastus acidophilus]|uniref:Arylsulfatase n=1 Tax=Candidatus Rhodoblastus alkanivorans TaxID=2954117 RepID=A0ABS9Z7C2_9HYPH|nr:arylsulfatase [Candidatus Rhodoblastus alkanivorans]MCI4678702.1 arylsulfatase [Candidatus Rhodoblastus alkanivorans]MCI4683502.1 arylsulfatase [Candidatus Rhodoblastus alkanivorans]MDI4640817.1 arylsulfatase [Rhodoblastus acidophilus]
MSWKTATLGAAIGAAVCVSPAAAENATKQPNFVIIWGDDIGQSDISAYSHGVMGFHTPNIDRIAKEGVMFTDYYGEQSCTAGRASFLTGQSGLRTGLTKVGLPGATLGLQKEDPTIAELLKPLGYATGQFGKNHLGDRNEFLPTVHGFDEFYGNLYHLNAEEEPELPDYPKNPAFRAKYGPRGVLDCKASDKDDPTVDPRFGPVGKQVCKDTGPLTKARMVTIDDDIANRAVDFIKREHEAGKPFFVWVNFTHMHFRTHTKPESIGQAGRWQSPYHDTMIDHDKNVGEILKALDDLGLDDNTFVMYSTDNGPHMNSWPDAAMTPFRNEKNSNWEGAYRVPAMFRWPGHIKPDTVSNGIVSHLDMFPTILAMAGEPEVAEDLRNDKKVGDMTYKVHLDGYDLVPYLTGKTDKDPRESFFYVNDDQQLVGLRYDNWKLVFMKQDAPGTLKVWANPFTTLRVPEIYNLRTDPYERATITSNTYYDWLLDHAFLLVPAQDYVGKFLLTLKDYPPRQKAASFNMNEVMDKLKQPGGAPD